MKNTLYTSFTAVLLATTLCVSLLASATAETPVASNSVSTCALSDDVYFADDAPEDLFYDD